ncbi:MAG: hypothetical protein AABW45_00005, partial [Nanoarchaeota archaeon]
LSLFLFPFFSYYSLLIFIFGFFIDADHYLYEMIKNKKLDLIEVYKMHMNKDRIEKDQLHIFHTLEFISVFILLTIFSSNIYLLLIGLGLILHLILDEIYLIHIFKNNVNLNSTRALSLFMWLKRNS